MLVVFLRAVILFVILFIVIRLMGKRELSKIQPFELAIIVMISDLAAGPMSSRDMPIFAGIIPIVSLLIMYIIFTLLIRSSNKVEKAICGSPTLVVFKGKIIEEELVKQNMTVEELMTQLRNADIYKVQDVAYALLETSGDINAVSITESCGQMPLNIISNGEYLENNMQILGMKKEEADKLIKKNKLKLENILVGTIDEKGKFIYQEKEESK